jgi:hypothetical protein
LPAVRKFVQQMEQLELAVREATTGQTGLLTVRCDRVGHGGGAAALPGAAAKAQPQLTISVSEIDSVDAVPALRRVTWTSHLRGCKVIWVPTSRR